MRTSLLLWLLCGIAGLLAACGGTLQPLQDPPQAAARAPEALLVTLQGKLDTAALARCHRALRYADENKVAWVVFYLIEGGDIGDNTRDLQSLYDHVQSSTIGTVALVQRASMGGAYLALLCDKLYLMRGGSIGLISSSERTWEEWLGLAPEDSERLRMQAYREELVQRLQHKKKPPSADALLLCAGMVDPTLQLVRVTVRSGGVEKERVVDQDQLRAMEKAGDKVLTQTPLKGLVNLDAREAMDCGLSSGTVHTREELVTDHLALDRSAIAELTPNWSEYAVSWLALLQPALLVLGFVLLVMEVKTPGIGLPGVLGTAFLGLALLYSYLVGLAEWTEVLLFFLGLAALAVEIFLLPGTIVFGAVGFLSIVAALILSQQSFVIPHSLTQQEILLQNLVNLLLLSVTVIASAIVLWKFLPRIPLMNRVFLAPPTNRFGGEPGAANATAPPSILLGRTGRALTVLRPAGAMELDGERLDVVTAGEFVEAGAAVRILEVQGNRIVVERIDTTGSLDGGERRGERGSVGLVVLIAAVGLMLLVAEVMLVSFGVLLMSAGVCLITAVFFAFQESVAFGVGTLVSESVAGPLVLYFAFKALPKTRMGKAMLLDGPKPEAVTASAADPSLQALLGKQGVTVSALRPAGFARIDGHKIDVVTRGEMLAESTAVKVIEVSGNRVVVTATAGR